MTLLFAVLDIILMSAAIVLSSNFARSVGARAYFNGLTVGLILAVIRRVDQLLILINDDYLPILPMEHGLDDFNTKIISLAVSICFVYGIADLLSRINACKKRSARDEAEKEAEEKVLKLSKQL